MCKVIFRPLTTILSTCLCPETEYWHVQNCILTWLQTGTHPRDTTARNCDRFRQQLQSLGFSYDWDREISTTDPGYYK